MKYKFYRPYFRNPACRLLQIGHKSEKWEWCYNLLTWRHRQFFFDICRVSLVKISYWCKLHVNIITGSRVMTIFLYMWLTRNPEIENNTICVLPNIWRLGWVRDIKFSTNVSNKMLLNAAKSQDFTAFTLYELLRKNQQGGKISPPTLIRVTTMIMLKLKQI